MSGEFAQLLGDQDRVVIGRMDRPRRIQDFLDDVPYSAEDRNRSPLAVLSDRRAHCLDGALFAAAALWELGYPPLLIDLLPDQGTDDDHVLALFRQRGHYGALAKSNFVGLRYREPVYRSLRELVMSYFDHFFNIDGARTLRHYTVMLDLRTLEGVEWMTTDRGADEVEERLKSLRRFPLLAPGMAESLTPVDPISYQAGMLVADQDGLYKPER